MPKSTVVSRKRNKKARASKLRWKKIKESCSNIVPIIYSESVASDYSSDTESKNASPSVLRDDSIFSHESEYGNLFFKHPDLNLRTYSRVGSRNRSQQDEHENGTISSDEYQRIQNDPLEYEYVERPKVITGNRIVDLGYVLETALEIQYRHATVCTLGRIIIKNEFHKGLVSTVVLICTQCNKTFTLVTERPTKSVSLINTGAVWGTLATGSTFAHLEECLSCLDIPMMTEKQFISTETSLGLEWKLSLWKSMEAAGAEEKKLLYR